MSVDGEVAGTIGVLGPTRMHYPRRWPRSTSSASAGAHRERPGDEARPRSTMATDYYALLGVGRDADDEEHQARLPPPARSCTPTAPGATSRPRPAFKEVTLAYEVLRDPERRARYDRFGAEGVDGPPPVPTSSAVAASATCSTPSSGLGGARRPAPDGGPMRGRRRRGGARARLPRGRVRRPARTSTVDEPVPCDTCEGSGARPGTTAVRCPECQGAGELRRVRQSILGQVVTAVPCGRCQGRGETIEPRARTAAARDGGPRRARFTVDVPAGIDHGSTLRLTGAGRPGTAAGRPATCTCTWRCVPTTCSAARTRPARRPPRVDDAGRPGGSVPFETLDGHRDLPIAAGTQSGYVIRLRAGGCPMPVGAGARGDLHVRVVVDTPTALTNSRRSCCDWPRPVGGAGEAPPARACSPLRSAFG